ncbi:hypothetical protein [Arsenicibacter rosenii]|uniref:Uncharacterized protein n=1 Tax=Arsenicibacter rosenii TaxID=1750698 RepID=A0A1S2VMG9_9BACT|nr:hypothetical protein [Arsenicibacter rosenii]OIN59963.1 hypothetical protein BLX24_09000 [Arsenicibacter rosenii]
MKENTLLHRQIHPNFVQNKIVSTQAFIKENDVASLSFVPKESDNNKLSVYNGDKFTPEQAYDHYTQKFTSFGVLSISKSECDSITPLSVAEDNDPFDGHSYIDFTAISSKNQIKIKAQKLRDTAIKRGWSYRNK